jgi:hypothetical protein
LPKVKVRLCEEILAYHGTILYEHTSPLAA